MQGGYDREAMERAFRRGLKSAKLIYLDNLKKKALQDYELHGEQVNLEKAFQQMKLFIGTNSQKVNAISLKDWRRFGLSDYIVDRLGYIAMQHDNPGHSASSGSIGSTTKSSSSRPTPSGSMHTEEQQYEEDFEEFDEEEYTKLKSLQDMNKVDDDRGSYAKTGSKKTNQSPGLISAVVEEEKLRPKASEDIITPRTTTPAGGVVCSIINGTRGEGKEATPPPKLRYPTQESVGISGSSSSGKGVLSAPSTSSSVSKDAVRASDVRSSGIARKGQQVPTWISNREWRMGEKIGAGSFGEVFQAMNNKGKLFAVKKMNMSNHAAELSKLWDEISVMRGLCHKHIVEYIGAFVDTSACCLYIFQEWVPGGSVAHLLKKFGPFSVPVVRNYTRQILFGLVYLHGKNIIHRDIKGGNVLVDDNGVVKLADFGASTRLSALNKTQETSTIQGTPYFMAPEVLSNNRYGRKGDIWAVGCTMIQMYTGEPPWKDMQLKGIVQLHMLLASWTAGPPPCSRPDLSLEARACLELCFAKQPDDRPTATELLLCSFLRDREEDLEESGAHPGGTLGGLDGTLRSQGDHLEDSGIMSHLKQQMAQALQQQSQQGQLNTPGGSSVGGPSGNSSTASPIDTFQEIDRRLIQHRASVNTPQGNLLPVPSRRGSGSQSSIQSDAVLRWNEHLPTGNNFGSPAATPRVPTSVYPSPKSSPTKALQPGSSSNPFARGSGPRTGDLRRVVLPGGPPSQGEEKVDAHEYRHQNNPVASEADFDLRRSLQGIKKKATAVRASALSTASATPPRSGRSSALGHPSLSSARDSEDLTPEPFVSDSESNPDSPQRSRPSRSSQQYISRRGHISGMEDIEEESRDYNYVSYSRQSPTQHGSPSAVTRGLTRYDTRYFEAKREEPSGGIPGIMPPPLGVSIREQSVESVEDMTEAYYKEVAAVSSLKERNCDDGLSASPIPDEEELFFTARQGPNPKHREDEVVMMMKKSASAADGVGIGARRVVPRLQALEVASTGSTPQCSVATPTATSGSKASKSISARIHVSERMYPMEEHVPRPFTSKAALGSVAGEAGERQASGGSWSCLKCRTKNGNNDTYCSNCATTRGAAGRRGNDVAIYRI